MRPYQSHRRFIGLEGCDGAGKTTLRQRIAKDLSTRTSRMLEIGQHSWIDPDAARIILNVREQRRTYDPAIIEDAYRRDKWLHEVTNVRPILDDGIVLADRTIISDAVYQEALYGIDAAATIHRYLEDGFLFPGTLIYVFVDIKTAVDRIAKRGKHRRHYERAVDLRRIRDIYLRILPMCEALIGLRVVHFENLSGELEARYQSIIEPELTDIIGSLQQLEVV